MQAVAGPSSKLGSAPMACPARSANLARSPARPAQRALVPAHATSTDGSPQAAAPPAVAGGASTHQPPPPPPAAATARRLVARRTAPSFRQAAVVEEAPVPAPGEGEVLVRVAVAGVNGGCETFRARGEHAFARNRQLECFPLGAEGAGVVVAAGPGVAAPSAGQAVAFVGGAFAEYVVAKAAACWPVPEASAEAVALTISGTVANCALKAVARLQPGETVLVTAAGGATGHLAAQLAAAAGARVVAVCGGGRKAAALRALPGIERVIEYTREGVEAVLSREYPRGLDVAYEGVGGALYRTAYRHLAPGGRLLCVGYISGYPHAQGYPAAGTPAAAAPSGGGGGGEGPPPPDRLFWGGQLWEGRDGRTVHGQVWPADRAELLACKREVFDLHAARRLAVWVDRERAFQGLDSVADAVDYMLTGKALGKVVVSL